MCLFHKWGKREEYKNEGTTTYTGTLWPKEVKGQSIPFAEIRQKRYCLKCNKMEDVKIRDGG